MTATPTSTATGNTPASISTGNTSPLRPMREPAATESFGQPGDSSPRIGRYVIGDVHGAGTEFAALCHSLRDHDLYCVGDLFDRGREAYGVLEAVGVYGVKCVLGNHERKMLQFLTGERPHLPPHYYFALERLRSNGAMKFTLVQFLRSLPLNYVLDNGDSKAIIVHAGVAPDAPRAPSVSWNVYGNSGERDEVYAVGMGGDVAPEPWWDQYRGDDLVVYGHLSQEPPHGYLPRRRFAGDDGQRLCSIGIDTCAVSGGPLTAFCLETGHTVTYQSGINHAANLKAHLQSLGKPWARRMRDELLGDW